MNFWSGATICVQFDEGRCLREDCDLYEFLGNVLREERRRMLIDAIISE